ncbi:MAG: hypothetical protein F6K42_38855 [Leptolyngbya sp. SIO1D8]|nr:hypothetical protein [Leptolyngbya sp. SIO1D8]
MLSREGDMDSQGFIEPNDDQLGVLLATLLRRLANDQTRLALWLMEECDLAPIPYQSIGAKSPLVGSTSELAGVGILIQLNTVDLEELIAVLTMEARLECEILHLEIEFQGAVQLAAYDHFGHVFFGQGIPLDLLETLKHRQVIEDYQVFSPQE